LLPISATRRRRLTIPLAALDAEATDVISQQSFSGSAVKVFFVSLIARDQQAAIIFEGTEKRENKPETSISGALSECYLVFQDQDRAEMLRQAVVRAVKALDGLTVERRECSHADPV
jgi:hypothetical protein